MEDKPDTQPSPPPTQAPVLIAADTSPANPDDSNDVQPEAASEIPPATDEAKPTEEVDSTAQVSEDAPVSRNSSEETLSIREALEEPAQNIPESQYADPTQPMLQVEDEDVPPPTPAKPVTSPEPVQVVPQSPPPQPPLPPLPQIIHTEANGTDDGRAQSPSLTLASTSSHNSHKRSMTTARGSNMSIVLISSALETIAASKEAKRSAALRDGIQNALELVKSNQAIERPREILEPLRLACETHNEKLVIASLDCISKLVSYSFFADNSDEGLPPSQSPPPSPGPNNHRSSMRGSHTSAPQPSLVELVAHTIFSCHHEATSDTVSVQIVKALLGLVLSQTTIVHHHSLLQSVRTVYNIYLLSATPQIQMLAQGSLTQMVDHVFNRCKPAADVSNLPPSRRSEDSLASFRTEPSSLPPPPSTSEANDQINDSASASDDKEDAAVADENDKDNVAESNTEAAEQSQPTANGHSSVESLAESQESPSTHELTVRDLLLKDAFLIFRALCKLSMKPIPPEDEQDPKAHAYRHKVMAIQLILHILNVHMSVVVDPASIIYSSSSHETPTFVQQITPHLCLALSRNAVSPVPQIFELSVEIFWRVLSGMRTKLKKEIEVLLHEIFIPILEMKTSTLKQKAVILGMLSRLCQEPQALVEIYLNYDCDGEAADNIYEHLMNIISKFVKTSTGPQHGKVVEPTSPGLSPTVKNHASASNSLNAGVLSVTGTMDTSTMGLSEAQLKRQALECLVSVLRSLVTWGVPQASGQANGDQTQAPTVAQSGDDSRRETASISDRLDVGSSEILRLSTPEPADDPTRFETAKQRKTTLLEGIKKFNFKPKRGIQFLIDNGFISDKSPGSIAKFLYETDGINKKVLGEYLGEGDPDTIAVMHAFVDMMEFRDTHFVDAIRLFLQAFRIPGEAQKIDRLMVKFAHRYIDGNPKTAFANADAAYVLGYSVIMLNTDAHSPQVKNRMTKAQFVKNNRGINDNADLPEELLSAVYDEITTNEIVMNDEIAAKLLLQQGQGGLASTLTSVGRDLQKEAYVIQTSGMSNKTETLLTMMRSQRKNSKGSDQFFSASHFVHVRPMFEVAWMPFLAGLSGPLQETDDLEVVELCLEGIKHAIHIVCFFDLDLQRNAFVNTLAKFTFLNNLGEMKIKNMEAIKTLLDVAVSEGNYLKTSWREVLTCVSQLEHMQLIGSGLDSDTGAKGRSKRIPNEELANQSRSTHITVAADMVFSLSHYLSGTAIVDFVRALCVVSWEEIQSSGKSDHPRLFSLQKLVDISYYNMNRIRLEWSNLWEILGEHFNQVCCHPNAHVAIFALDALRQLAARFLEKEELPHFKFQKDFLKPFEYAMIHNQNTDIRDMVLQCLHQMIQAKVQNLRSGWRTMFGVFSAATRVYEERIVVTAFEIVRRLNQNHFLSIVKHGAFADLTVCITDFCKIGQYQKISLSAIAMLRGTIPIMLATPECGLSTDNASQNPDQAMDEGMIKYWFPVLFGFYDIIMNSDDLEVRRLALDSLFESLKQYGQTFPHEFWDTILQELLFPIFAILKNKNDLSRFHSQGDMSVWLQSTMFQALRSLIDLYTFHFAILERLLDGLLDLLCVCICQETKALSQIGTSCLQQLLETNVTRLSAEKWDRVTSTFAHLFRSTTPHQLFDENLRAESVLNQAPSEAGSGAADDNDGSMILPAPLSPNMDQQYQNRPMTAGDRQQIFSQIIVKCILQLLLIEMASELMNNADFYKSIPADQLLRLVGILTHSYQFARMFNEDKQLRTELWRVGFMKHLPNLLKQESTSAATLIHVLWHMYFDPRPDYRNARPQIAERALPLGLGILDDYNKLHPETQKKNILAWNPVVTEFLDGISRLDDRAFSRYLSAVYPPALELLSGDIPHEIRQALKAFLLRVGQVQGIIETSAS